MSNKKIEDTLAKLYFCFSLAEIRAGLSLTFMQLISAGITLKFPHEITPRSRRYRGALALRKYPNGEERCIACKLCEATCPALAITIESKMDEKTGARRTTRFDIDAFKCVHCGLCEEACPVDAIVQGPNFEFSTETREELYYTKEKLLDNGDRWENVLEANIKADNIHR